MSELEHAAIPKEYRKRKACFRARCWYILVHGVKFGGGVGFLPNNAGFQATLR